MQWKIKIEEVADKATINRMIKAFTLAYLEETSGMLSFELEPVMEETNEEEI